MPDVWLPGAHIDRGRNAGYNSGRSQMRRAVAHYTVGSDSRNVGRDGYFHFLVHRDASRENGCTQYAEIDAITWHAADAGNPYGPGVEWERMTTGGMNAEGLSNAQPLTANQLDWGERLVQFFADHGIPPALYDGPRYGEGGWRGWVNHQAIDSSRSDGLTRAEWDQLTGGGSTSPPVPDATEGETMEVTSGVADTHGETHLFCIGNDGHLYWSSSRPEGTYPEWRDLGMPIDKISALPVATFAPYDDRRKGVVTVTVRNHSREGWVRRFYDDGGGWTDWQKLGGAIVDPKL